MLRWHTDGRYHAYLTRLILARLTWTTATDNERADAVEMCSESGLKIRAEAVKLEDSRVGKSHLGAEPFWIKARNMVATVWY